MENKDIKNQCSNDILSIFLLSDIHPSLCTPWIKPKENDEIIKSGIKKVLLKKKDEVNTIIWALSKWCPGPGPEPQRHTN